MTRFFCTQFISIQLGAVSQVDLLLILFLFIVYAFQTNLKKIFDSWYKLFNIKNNKRQFTILS